MPSTALPTDTDTLRVVARVAISQLSRRLLTESIARCERQAVSLGGPAAAEWRDAADTFRAERKRRYG